MKKTDYEKEIYDEYFDNEDNKNRFLKTKAKINKIKKNAVAVALAATATGFLTGCELLADYPASERDSSSDKHYYSSEINSQDTSFDSSYSQSESQNKQDSDSVSSSEGPYDSYLSRIKNWGDLKESEAAQEYMNNFLNQMSESEGINRAFFIYYSPFTENWVLEKCDKAIIYEKDRMLIGTGEKIGCYEYTAVPKFYDRKIYQDEGGYITRVDFKGDDETQTVYKVNEEKQDFSNEIMDLIQEINWTQFDASCDFDKSEVCTYKGSLNGKDYYLETDGTFFGDNLTVHFFPLDNKSYIYSYYKNPVIDQSGYVYLIKDGEVDIKSDMLVQALNNYLENHWVGQQFFTYLMQKDNISGKFIYARTTKGSDDIRLGYVATMNGTQPLFGEAIYHDSDFIDDWSAHLHRYNGYQEFLGFTNGIRLNHFTLDKFVNEQVEYTTMHPQYNEKEFTAISKNIFSKLENNGVQGESIDGHLKDSNIEGMSDAKILFGTMGKRYNYDATYVPRNFVYVVDLNGKLELFNINVRVNIKNTESKNNSYQHIIDNDDKWYINEIERYELDEDNRKLFEDSATKTVSTKMAITDGSERKKQSVVKLENNKEREV